LARRAACQAIGKTASEEACGPGPGWFATVTDAGLEIGVCPDTCERIRTDDARLLLVLTPDCETVLR
jgi:hypothetical protein